jgi:hypothetical protein
MGGRHGVPPPAARIEISRGEIREREGCCGIDKEEDKGERRAEENKNEQIF